MADYTGGWVQRKQGKSPFVQDQVWSILGFLKWKCCWFDLFAVFAGQTIRKSRPAKEVTFNKFKESENWRSNQTIERPQRYNHRKTTYESYDAPALRFPGTIIYSKIHCVGKCPFYMVFPMFFVFLKM